jgi:methylenetetrahydrofolate reductase (NADPH)
MIHGHHGDTDDVVAALVRAADIEIIPVRGASEKLVAIPADTTVTVTCSAKFGLGRTLDFTALAAKSGYRVVPHLAARQVTDRAELRDFVGRLDDLGVRDLYVIGGDAAEPAGVYGSAAELLDDLAGIDNGLESIGVACYPEGHPTISDANLLDALLRKQAHATYMVSQMCFDLDALVTWLREIRSQGIHIPLHIGLAAPLKSRKLVELSLKIGVGSSIKYLTKQHGVLGNLVWGGSYRPEKSLRTIADALSSDELGIESLHLFSFNQIDATVDWQRRIAGSGKTAAV